MNHWQLSLDIQKDWIADCEKACSSEEEFQNFKRLRTIGYVTENRHACHVIKEWERAKFFWPGCVDLLPGLAAADLLGNPLPGDVAEVDGYILSGGAVGAARMCAQIRFLFGPGPFDVAEIGGGCGTLAHVLHLFGMVRSYTGFDLEAPSRLQKKYLERQGWGGNWPVFTGIERHNYDLSISAYSFSELNSSTREHYLKTILWRSRMGYHVWNWVEPDKDNAAARLEFKGLPVVYMPTLWPEDHTDDWERVYTHGFGAIK